MRWEDVLEVVKSSNGSMTTAQIRDRYVSDYITAPVSIASVYAKLAMLERYKFITRTVIRTGTRNRKKAIWRAI